MEEGRPPQGLHPDGRAHRGHARRAGQGGLPLRPGRARGRPRARSRGRPPSPTPRTRTPTWARRPSPCPRSRARDAPIESLVVRSAGGPLEFQRGGPRPPERHRAAPVLGDPATTATMSTGTCWHGSRPTGVSRPRGGARARRAPPAARHGRYVSTNSSLPFLTVMMATSFIGVALRVDRRRPGGAREIPRPGQRESQGPALGRASARDGIGHQADRVVGQRREAVGHGAVPRAERLDKAARDRVRALDGEVRRVIGPIQRIAADLKKLWSLKPVAADDRRTQPEVPRLPRHKARRDVVARQEERVGPGGADGRQLAAEVRVGARVLLAGDDRRRPARRTSWRSTPPGRPSRAPSSRRAAQRERGRGACGQTWRSPRPGRRP